MLLKWMTKIRSKLLDLYRYKWIPTLYDHGRYIRLAGIESFFTNNIIANGKYMISCSGCDVICTQYIYPLNYFICQEGKVQI